MLHERNNVHAVRTLASSPARAHARTHAHREAVIALEHAVDLWELLQSDVKVVDCCGLLATAYESMLQPEKAEEYGAPHTCVHRARVSVRVLCCDILLFSLRVCLYFRVFADGMTAKPYVHVFCA